MTIRAQHLAAVLFLFSVLAAVSAAQVGGRRGLPGSVAEAPPVTPAQPPVPEPDTVMLNVSVTGQQNNAVTGIGRERFQVLEDGVDQKVTYFWEDSRPITIGFVFDDSARMGENDKINVLKEAGASFLRGKRPNDEYFVVRMADFADVVVSFTTDPGRMPSAYSAVGETALYDAIHVGLDVIKEAANSRKFLLVITSGGDRCCSDNNKTVTDQQLISYALKQPVQIYTLFVVDTIADDVSEFVHRDASLLGDLALITGGRMSNAPNAARSVEALVAEVARGLRTQYLIGYKSTQPARDGKRRGIRVRVSTAEREPRLNVWTKSGYYAPKER
jgi:VWFA-related protein